jgi:hypothetical protein
MSTASLVTLVNITKIEHLNSSIMKMNECLDNTNWVVGCELICHIFAISGIEPYVYGQLPCPDSAVDCQMAEVWCTNDMYAQILVMSNILKDQMVHVAWLNTASEIWVSLHAIHKTKDYGVVSKALSVESGINSDWESTKGEFVGRWNNYTTAYRA